MTKVSTDYDIIGFYILFIILTNFFIIGFSSSLIQGSDYLTQQEKYAYSQACENNPIGCAFSVFSWLLTADIPESSNTYWVSIGVKIVLIVEILYGFLVGWTILKYIRGVM